MVDWFFPSQGENHSLVEWVGRMQRLSVSPADFQRQVMSVIALEAPSDLTTIKAPTLIIHVVGDRVIPVESSRALAAAIPGARLVELPGEDHFGWLMDSWRQDSDLILSFLTGEGPRSTTVKRVATVLFTDLVDSTAKSSTMGDDAWRGTLESHNRICSQVIDRHDGHIVKSTGDGLLATFDDPSNAVDAACDLLKKLSAIGLTIRAGLHTGQIEIHDDEDISGLAVNLASRIEHSAKPGTVFASSTVRDILLGGELKFADQGEFELKGIEGQWRLYSVND